MTVRVASHVAQVLRAHGIRTIYGLMGDGNLHQILAFVEEQQGQFVSTVSEGGAISMADGAARSGGRVAVASVTHGPGVTNGLTALTEAVRARSRVLVLTGDTPAVPNHLQALDLRAAAQLTGAEYVRVSNPDSAVDQVRGVLRRLRTTPAPIPVMVDLPSGLAEERITNESSILGPGAGTHAVPPASLPVSTDEALGAIASARRPVIVAGQGALQAREQLLRLSTAIGAPTATTLLGQGLFEGTAHDLGVCGTVGRPGALEAISDSDCLIAFGASLNRFTTGDGAATADKAVVHVDADPTALGRHTQPTHALVGDAAATAAFMCEQLTLADHVPGGWNERAASGFSAPEVEPRDTAKGTVDLATAMDAANRILPAHRLVVSDTGRFIYTAWRHLHALRPASFIHTLNFASIGLGLATAIGVALSHPDRLTVAVVGDGGGMMGLGELATAVREKAPLLVLVANDAAYGMEHHNLSVAGHDPSHSHLTWPDFAALADGFGAAGHTVTNLEDLEAVLMNLADVPERPTLIDLRLDRNAIPGE